jgi:O-antigen/teichoic acid export membrane protein
MRVGGVRARKLGWGLLDQAGSSLTNLLLTVAAGRILGPSALGGTVIGVTAYLFLLGLQRAAVSQPLVVFTSAAISTERRDAASRNAVTVALLAGVLLASAMAVAGWATGGVAGRGLLLFAPWMPGVLAQDLWRAILFRDSRGSAAALNDWLWLAAMVLALAATWGTASAWVVVGAWGFGGSVGAAVGFAQTRSLPTSPMKGWTGWRRELWPLGRWLSGSSIAYSAGSQASVLVIAGLLGPAALGGLRAVQTVFAPLSLLSSAVALPALPAMSRRLAASLNEATRFALTLSALLIVMTATYVVPVGLAGSEVLTHVFGVSFQSYRGLVLPIVLQQLVTAGGGGFMLLLLAKRGGRAVFAISAAVVPVTLLSIAIGNAAAGLVGVAWGLGAATTISTTITGVLAFRTTAGPESGEQVPSSTTSQPLGAP